MVEKVSRSKRHIANRKKRNENACTVYLYLIVNSLLIEDAPISFYFVYY